jgi:AcrR family transcriptional regulator
MRATATSTARISTSFNTKERLLDAAEQLFAEYGIDATSMRDLTTQAAANLASVNYHFGSKEGMVKALLERRLKPLNDERMRLLDLAESAAGRSSPTLESILHAFVAPTIRSCREHPHFMRLMARLQLTPNPDLRNWMLQTQFTKLIERMEKTLARALPHVPVAELYWRMSFLVGAVCHTWTSVHDVEVLSGGKAAFTSDEEMIERLVTFGSAGLRAECQVAVGAGV